MKIRLGYGLIMHFRQFPNRAISDFTRCRWFFLENNSTQLGVKVEVNFFGDSFDNVI